MHKLIEWTHITEGVGEEFRMEFWGMNSAIVSDMTSHHKMDAS